MRTLRPDIINHLKIVLPTLRISYTSWEVPTVCDDCPVCSMQRARGSCLQFDAGCPIAGRRCQGKYGKRYEYRCLLMSAEPAQ